MTAASVAANLGGVAFFALPGLGLSELFASLRRLSLPRRLGYAWLLGVVGIGGILFLLSHLFAVPLRRPVLLAVAFVPVALGLTAWLRRRRGQARAAAEPARRRNPWQTLALLALFAAGLGPLASALAAPLADWDGRMTWGPLASYVRHEGSVDASVLRDSRWWVIHPRYPPLLPLAQAAIQETLGAGEDEQDFRAFYVTFLFALLLVVHDGARRAAGPVMAVLTPLAVALPPFWSYGGGGATSAYSDLPLAGFYGAGCVLLFAAQPSVSAGFAAGCLLAGAVLTKNEGALLAVAVLLLAAFRLLWSRSPRPTGWFAAAASPVLLALGLLASWRSAIPNRADEDYWGALHLTELLRGAVSRLPLIVPEILRWTFRWSDWLGFWILFLAVVILGWRALRRPLARRMLLAGLVPPAVAYAAYAVSSRAADLIGETWERFLLQGLVPLTVLFAAALGHALRRRGYS
ncbi:MAG TPA: hypothetical protein VF173_15095 [Thermoanaerobaculia bacterium]|nr:hypothetical protein [Thermoanaerobaculia bacterium]